MKTIDIELQELKDRYIKTFETQEHLSDEQIAQLLVNLSDSAFRLGSEKKNITETIPKDGLVEVTITYQVPDYKSMTNETLSEKIAFLMVSLMTDDMKPNHDDYIEALVKMNLITKEMEKRIPDPEKPQSRFQKKLNDMLKESNDKKN